jgi:hypothetical protein
MKLFTRIEFAWDGSVIAEESFEYSGYVALCKGASSAEVAQNTAQTELANTLTQDFSTTFAQQQGILSNLTSQLSPIINAGPSQFGYTPAQVNALNTQATTGTAQQYQNAKQAAGDASAAAGGGNSFLPTSTTQQTQANIATAAANTESNQLLGIQTAGWNQGTQNYNNAVGQILSASGQLAPNSYATNADQTNNNAFNQQSQITQQNNAASPWNAIGGALGGVAGTFIGMPGLGASIGSALGGGLSGSWGPTTTDNGEGQGDDG